MSCNNANFNVNNANSVCAILSTTGPASGNLAKCCGTAAVNTTPDGCFQYCDYPGKESLVLDKFVECLGNDGLKGAQCLAPHAEASISAFEGAFATALRAAASMSSASAATGTGATPTTSTMATTTGASATAATTSASSDATKSYSVPRQGWTKCAMAMGLMALVFTGMLAQGIPFTSC